MLYHFLVGALLLPAAVAIEVADLKLVFRPSKSLEPLHLHAATEKEYANEHPRQLTVLGCAPYLQASALTSQLNDMATVHHPVYYSASNNRVCHVFQYHTTPRDVSSWDYDNLSFTVVPQSLKYGDSVDKIASERADSEEPFTIEIGIGLGVSGKGSNNNHDDVAAEIIASALEMKLDSELHTRHLQEFYWTSDAAHTIDSEQISHRRRLLSTTDCDFSSLEIESTTSHVTLTSRGHVSSACMTLLASIASTRDDISFVNAHGGYVSYADYYNKPNTPNATDQNAWIQSGTSTRSPYSDIGLDGAGYVLGFIDTGADDLSCFLIDSTGERTTRTPRNQYSRPVIEHHRRKVVQYLAWADGLPSENYDHGTWCGGASVGQCVDTKKYPGADAYNGLAPEAKMTMFDVVVTKGDKWVNVPSLTKIALPPAYEAGVRVHSNSWGAKGMTSYTSKALEVDEYVTTHPDFLFVVAAGNDGDRGYDSLGSPGVSKNALTIGASASNHNNIVYFSGIGKAFDGMVKPDVIGPGTDLMSAGVGNGTATCNKQISSGTSMATPIVAASAMLIRQYYENSNFWAKFCRKSYRSCPNIVSGDKHVSAALLKASVVHAATDMRQLLATKFSNIPKTNLTEPPDRFQGWGQVLLRQVLPIPGVYDFDLYVADYEALESMQRRLYHVTVTNSSYPLVVTIVWMDPPNVLWAAKNLLNDLDLAVVDAMGTTHYGNRKQGDEYNSVERVVLHTPIVGEYLVTVTSKQLAVGPSQDYSIVITSGGYVEESKTVVVPITDQDVIMDVDTLQCKRSYYGGKGVLFLFQLEDWMAGSSWTGVDFTIQEKFPSGQLGKVLESYTFGSNEQRMDSPVNRIVQLSACLQDGKTYVARVNALAAPRGKSKYIRVAGPQCNMFLSDLQQEAELVFRKGECNACGEGSSEMVVLMRSNVTDDDARDYTWRGLAHYTISSVSASKHHRHKLTQVAAGKLLVSDEEADRYCFPNGMYKVELQDEELFKLRRKNAFIDVTYPGGELTLSGTASGYVTLGDVESLALEGGGLSSLGMVTIVACVGSLAMVSAFLALRIKKKQYEDVPSRETEVVPLIRRGYASIDNNL